MPIRYWCRNSLQSLTFTATMSVVLALGFSARAAGGDICEASHLSVSDEFSSQDNLELFASKLALWRLEIYRQDNGSGQKARSDEEFKAKYKEFESLAGDNKKAREIFREQMSLAKRNGDPSKVGENERWEKEQRAQEKSVIQVDLGRQMLFHTIQSGSFRMARPGPQDTVEITKPFGLMATPTTQSMWRRVAELAGSKLGGRYQIDIDPSLVMKDEIYPVNNISFEDVQRWIGALNELSEIGEPALAELIPGHKRGDVYRLPSEAEWEFVIRGRGQYDHHEYFGSDRSQLSRYAWHAESSNQQLQAVAQLMPLVINGKEFYDMLGNVWEFMRDGWSDQLRGGRDPVEPDKGSKYVIRGGGYYGTPFIRIDSLARAAVEVDAKRSGIGFRLAREAR